MLSMNYYSSCKVRRKFSKSSTIFRYPPLSSNQIRVLTLHPGHFDSHIEITLQVRDLNSTKNTYEALSYVWGDPTRRVSIECNGCELKITTSLHIALRRLRFQNEPRLLWVDAICIDQDDLDERAQQVPLMKEIYSTAYKVLIWLGEADEKTELAHKAIGEWASFNRQYRLNSDSTRFSKFEERFSFNPHYRATLEAVGELSNRSWFNRCWTFQEIVLSSRAEILVGKFSLTWECFYHALEAFPIHLLADNVLNFNAIFMCHGKAKVKKTNPNDSDSIPVSRCLSRVLQITRNFIATDPRDKIFSVISIATMKNPSIFRPDYSKSVRDTFISLTLAMIRDEDSLNVLMSSGEHDRDKSLPSWCPDWSCKRGVTLTGYFDYISYSINAGLNPDLSNLQMNENYELELQGTAIDIVKEVYDLEDLGNELKASVKDINFISVLSKFSRTIGLHKYLLHDQLSPEAVLLRTLSADHWFFGAHLRSTYKEIWFPTHLRFRDLKINEAISRRRQRISPAEYHSRISVMPSLNINSMGSIPRDPKDNISTQTAEHLDYEVESPFTHAVIDKVYRQASPFYIRGQDFDDAKNIDSLTLVNIAKEAISQAIFFFKGKRILISERGFVAIGSAKTKVGDNLCSFWGADVPFVIREKKATPSNGYISRRNICINSNKRENHVNDVYEIIGECYIDGIMYGELYSVKRSKYHQGNEKQHSFQHVQPLVDWIEMKKFTIA